mmetsp:Transcript_51736/g.123130  ORF Transcript_51736/g.123130 Transcript_51736/m.123130 type:complete len:90 (+) Transcript_51736:172-441(+)
MCSMQTSFSLTSELSTSSSSLEHSMSLGTTDSTPVAVAAAAAFDQEEVMMHPKLSEWPTAPRGRQVRGTPKGSLIGLSCQSPQKLIISL